MSVNPLEPGRRSLPHLPPLEFANQTTVIFLTMCVQQRRPLLARAEIVALLLDCWREADHWLGGSLGRHAGSSAPLLRASDGASDAGRILGAVLAQSSDSAVALSGRNANLAARFFRPSSAERRKLPSEVAVSLGESDPGGDGEAAGGLAASGGDERVGLARCQLMSGARGARPSRSRLIRSSRALGPPELA